MIHEIYMHKYREYGKMYKFKVSSMKIENMDKIVYQTCENTTCHKPVVKTI